MTRNVTVKWRNKDRLFAKLNRLAPELQKGLTKANRKSAEQMTAYARSQVPVKTGELRRSIEVTPPGETPPGGGPPVPAGAFRVSAGNDEAWYARLVEFGAKPHIAGGKFAGASHPGSPPQPFFWPAYRLIRRLMRNRATRAINKAVKKVASK